jgi:hypothetical protein
VDDDELEVGLEVVDVAEDKELCPDCWFRVVGFDNEIVDSNIEYQYVHVGFL